MEHKSDQNPELTTAILTVAFEDAQTLRQRDLDVPGSGAGSGGAPLQNNGQPRPKGLEKGDWQRGVDRWQSQWDPPRTFPNKMLVGAEDVLARLLWEKRVSKAFMPLFLSEIIDTRAYQSDGNTDRVAKPR